MRILLSNDDGVHAPGLHAMHKRLKQLGEVWVVAPMEEKSTTGHSLTIHKPLRMNEFGDHVYGVSGSPADCVYLGIREVMKRKPDLVISGINRGANLGQDVYYSGTVSAAREACMLGIPAFAVSLAVDFSKRVSEADLHYDTAAQVTVKTVRQFLRKKLIIPKFTLMNLNVPNLPLSRMKGTHIVRQGFRVYSGSILRRKDHRGKYYYWVGGQYQGFVKEEGTDCYITAKGYAALTPLKLDCTNFDFLEELERTGGFK